MTEQPIPHWPADLPAQPLRQGWQLSRTYAPPLKSEMNSGLDRARKRFTVRMGEQRVAFDMTASQCKRLMQFLHDDLNDGASPFVMPVWEFDDLIERRVRMQEAGPSYEQVGFLSGEPAYRVTFGLMVEY